MRILIIGGDGMLGHQLYRELSHRHEVRVTLHRPVDAYTGSMFTAGNALGAVDVRDVRAVREAVRGFTPQVVVNAAGVIKQRVDAQAAAIEVNALFPHRLAEICGEGGAYLVHYSTDCVFSGRKGGYTESDVPDPIDLYGHSKLLGELDRERCITLRTSMIGPELGRRSGLLEWFLSQQGRAPGYRRAVFSGLTTPEQARLAERVLTQNPLRSGIFHVSGEPISKFELLRMIAQEFGLSTEVVPDDSVVVDRSLDSSRFRAAFAYRPPAWREMLNELARARRPAS